MSKSPHTAEFRAMVSQQYLDRVGSYPYLANKYGIGRATLQQWVAKYRIYGIAAFADAKGNKTYSSSFKKKYNSSTPEVITENVLCRDFYATAPNQKWATDVTEFKVPGEKKKIYLSTILDLYDRYPVAYVISTRNDNRLVFKTFDKALSKNPDVKPIFHSDRGCQYTSKVFQRKLKEHQMEQSMSRVGHCIDNGPTEGFWGILKTEMYQMYEITDEQSLRIAIRKYMKFYSEERLQNRYQCKTPLQVRTEALLADKPQEYLIPVNKRIQKYKQKWCA